MGIADGRVPDIGSSRFAVEVGFGQELAAELPGIWNEPESDNHGERE